MEWYHHPRAYYYYYYLVEQHTIITIAVVKPFCNQQRG
jgi:hypothetical protein